MPNGDFLLISLAMLYEPDYLKTKNWGPLQWKFLDILDIPV